MIAWIVSGLLFFSSGHKPYPGAHVPFYKVTKAGSSDTSYLFGTLHLLESSYVDTMPRVMAALKHSDVVVGELSMDSVSPASALAGLIAERPLDSVLTKEEYGLVKQAVKEYAHIPMMMLNLAQPIVAYAVVMEGMYEKSHPENHVSGVPMDLFFQHYAEDSGKKVIGLEEASDQEQVLDSIPLQEQIDELMELVRNPKAEEKQMDQMLEEYREGKIAEILDDPSFGKLSPKEMEAMLNDRNQKWLRKLPDILEHHNAFIAVGAGHLPGKHGLVEGLRKLGYEVNLLKNE